MRWIGDEFSLKPAKLLDVTDEANLVYMRTGKYVFDDGTNVFALNDNKAFAPSVGDWRAMSANKAHWYIQDVRLTQLGTYKVYVHGDDEQRLALNGIPIVWSDVFNNVGSVYTRQMSGTFDITDEGLYQLLVMQVNVPNNTPSWTAVVIKQPDGTTLNLINNWKYIETTFDCDNKYIVPTVQFNYLNFKIKNPVA